MMMSGMMVTLFFLSRLRMIARFLAVVNCLYGAGEIFVGLFILFAIVSGLTTPPSRRQHKCWTTCHRLGGARETPPRSGNGTLHVPFPSSQMAKSPPRRGKAFWSAARFVCRMTIYACRSSSHKTRYAIFVGTLKDKKALSRPLHRGGYNKESLKLCCKQGCLAQQDSICTLRVLIVQ